MRFDFEINDFCELNQSKDKTAVVGTDRTLSWGQVYTGYLKLKELFNHIPNDKPVIIYGEKESIFPVAMLALMNLSITYVPVDAIMPAERVKKIMELSQSVVVVNCSSKQFPAKTEFLIDNTFNLIIGKKSQTSFSRKAETDPIRYILFTSGSTGEPKGVQITATALNSFIRWYTSWPKMNASCIFMNQAPFSFDVSLCDFIGTFYHGATLVLNSYDILKNPGYFLPRLGTNRATTMVCTPSFIYMYLSSADFNSHNFPSLDHFVFMGEELPAISVKKLKALFPKAKIVNAYGPTEATVVVTYVEITEELLNTYPKSLPIGFMKPGTDMLVLNETNNAELPGDLVIVGENVSIGYLNNQEKNHVSFYTVEGKRAYRTGDIGYIKNGMVFYLGRNDNQVKLNGYRIELDEITNVLLRNKNIVHAATIPLKQGNTVKKIISFITISSETIDVAQLKNEMTEYLPSYMIPSDILIMQEIPMNSNYKTDKKALVEYYMNL